MKKRVRVFLAGISAGLILCGCRAETISEEMPGGVSPAAWETSEEAGEEEIPPEAGPSAEPEEEAGAPDQAREEEPAFSFLMEEASVYAYNSLTEVEQIWYRDIEEILGAFWTERKISRVCLEKGLGEEDIDRIFQCVLNDHPELFYVEGYSYVKYTRGDIITSIVFSGSYSMSFEEAVERRAEIEEAAEEILAQIGEDACDYEKVKYVYETLILNTEYQLDSPDNQNIYSVFINHTSVCQGYAKATQYLLNLLGVECTLVLGTVDTGEVHAWNLVKLDGSYYYLDTTWGDASYQISGEEEMPGLFLPEINYDYLCVTTAELFRTHTLGGQLPMPVCDSMEHNYYVQEGALFREYDREQMKELCRRAVEQGKTDITVKCMDIACYQEVISSLIDGQEIFRYLSGKEGSVAYVQNDNQLSLTFWVTNE